MNPATARLAAARDARRWLAEPPDGSYFPVGASAAQQTITGRTAPRAADWAPPLDGAELARIALLLRGVIPLEQIVDDIGDVLGNQDPRQPEFEDLAERLRADVARLVTIATAKPAAGDDETPRLIERARALSAETLPADHRPAIGYLRRLAGVANELLERLAETGVVKDVA